MASPPAGLRPRDNTNSVTVHSDKKRRASGPSTRTRSSPTGATNGKRPRAASSTGANQQNGGQSYHEPHFAVTSDIVGSVEAENDIIDLDTDDDDGWAIIKTTLGLAHRPDLNSLTTPQKLAFNQLLQLPQNTKPRDTAVQAYRDAYAQSIPSSSPERSDAIVLSLAVYLSGVVSKQPCRSCDSDDTRPRTRCISLDKALATPKTKALYNRIGSTCSACMLYDRPGCSGYGAAGNDYLPADGGGARREQPAAVLPQPADDGGRGAPPPAAVLNNMTNSNNIISSNHDSAATNDDNTPTAQPPAALDQAYALAKSATRKHSPEEYSTLVALVSSSPRQRMLGRRALELAETFAGLECEREWMERVFVPLLLARRAHRDDALRALDVLERLAEMEEEGERLLMEGIVADIFRRFQG